VKPSSTTALILLLLLSGACLDERELSGPRSQSAAEAGSPLPTITYGPQYLHTWGTHVRFEWATDPGALHYEVALTRLWEFAADTGDSFPPVSSLIAWLDSVSVHPGTSDEMWVQTSGTTAEFADVPETVGSDKVIFGVRSVYEAQNHAPLAPQENFVLFDVTASLTPPSITVATNLGDCRTVYSATTPSEMISPALRFEWSTTPGASQLPVVMTEWKADDGTWTVSSTMGPDRGAYPEGETELWRPGPGPHQLSVRATDQEGYQRTLDFPFEVIPPAGRGILVVQDTNVQSLVYDLIVPASFPLVEAAAIDAWMGDHFTYELHPTGGNMPPSSVQLARASTVIWVHTADFLEETVLGTAMQGDPFYPLLSSWQQAGGNLVLCGVQPSNALRFFLKVCGADFAGPFPISFGVTETTPGYIRHFALDGLGLDQIGETVRNQFPAGIEPLARAVPQMPLFPELDFDPLRWQNGQTIGGFGCFDVDLVPYGNAEVLYTLNDTGRTIAVANLKGRGRNGSSVFLGFHPYFMNDFNAAAFFDVVLSEFGEIRRESAPTER